MTKRGKVWAGAGIAIWGAGMTAALFVMRDANQSSQQIEATRDVPKAPPSPAEPVGRSADVNGDGDIDLDDILLVMHEFSSADPCEPPCLADICCCGPYRLDLDDLVAVLRAFSGETLICPPMECPEPAVAIRVECEDADGVLVLAEPDADGGITVMEGQRCVYTAVPAAEPGERDG